jgi:hypothetical protein
MIYPIFDGKETPVTQYKVVSQSLGTLGMTLFVGTYMECYNWMLDKGFNMRNESNPNQINKTAP